MTVVVVVVCVERESIGFLIYYLYCEAEALARSTRVLSSVSFFVAMCSTVQGRLNGNYDHPPENQEKIYQYSSPPPQFLIWKLRALRAFPPRLFWAL